jgi:hypothetical protein
MSGRPTSHDRLAELVSKLEVATTDGDLSAFTSDDIGHIYSWLLMLADLINRLNDMRRMGQQKDDPNMANEATKLLQELA